MESEATGHEGGGVVLAVTYRAGPGHADRVAQLLAAMVQAVATHEPGCLSYDVARSIEDPQVFLLYERYVDDTAFDAHRRTAHFHDLVERQVWPLLQAREPARYRFLAGARPPDTAGSP
jgi:quinol monooxygenase YgiN